MQGQQHDFVKIAKALSDDNRLRILTSLREGEKCACELLTDLRISQPTLLIAAEKDDITPIEAERHLQTLFPDAELVEIADVGHLIHYETPQVAASAVRRFLRPSGAGTR